MSASGSIAATAYAEGVKVMEEALAEAARAQWDGRRADLHRQRRRLIELRRSVPNDKLDPEAQVVRDLLTTYATVLDETAQRTEYRRGLDLTQETRAELERLRGRAARAGLPVLDERTGDFRHVRRESRPGRPPRGDAPPRSRRQRTQDGPPVPPPGDGEGPAPKRRRRRRRSRGSTTAAG